MTNNEIYLKAIETFGEETQKLKLIEEMAELTKEVCKNFDIYHIAEEIADVEIMLEQVKIIYDCSLLVNAQKQYKLERLVMKINSVRRQNDS